MATRATDTAPKRADIRARTLRTDAWWLAPVTTAAGLLAFVLYSGWAAFQNTNYAVGPYISPLYSPCIAANCGEHAQAAIIGDWWKFSPALLILIVPLGFRFTCYYYRKAYYRAFWLSPPACAVAEPHKSYSGETRFPLILQNIHRYFLYLALVFNVILTIDAVIAFRDFGGAWGHMGLGTVVLVINAVLLWLYSLSCHSCRHLCGGRVNKFSSAKSRYWMWKQLTRLNERHMLIAWVSLVWVGLTDLYVRLVAGGVFSDPRFF